MAWHGMALIEDSIHFSGTIVAMEKAPGILKREHIAIIEAERDAIEKDLKSWRQENSKN